MVFTQLHEFRHTLYNNVGYLRLRVKLRVEIRGELNLLREKRPCSVALTTLRTQLNNGIPTWHSHTGKTGKFIPNSLTAGTVRVRYNVMENRVDARWFVEKI